MKNVTPLLILLIFVLYPHNGESGSIKRSIVKRLTPKAPSPPKQSVPTPTTSPIVISEDPIKQCRATVLPSFINNSMSWGPEREKIAPFVKIDVGRAAYKGLNALSPPSILVTAAGNDYPKPITRLKTSTSKNFNAIIVGSMAPDGFRSYFSQTGEEVHITAPSDTYITSANEDGSYRQFGGTSGATPLVTGSLAGFEWLASYHPTAEEAKILLAKTAIPTIYANDQPKKNGVGMVNAYKLGMVGKHLKQMCGSNISCFKKLIQEDGIYEFSEDPGLSEALDRAFPRCSRTTCGPSNNDQAAVCSDKAAVVERLRKAAFLNPQNKELWRNLACIYAAGGFTENSKGIMRIYEALSKGVSKKSQFCQTDEDCTFTPLCKTQNINKPCMPDSHCENKEIIPPEQSTKLWAMNKAAAEMYYIKQCLKTNTLCNNKCRCGNKEEVKVLSDDGVSIVSHNVYQSKCVNSICTKLELPLLPSPVKMPPSPPVKKPAEGSGTVR